MNKVEIERVMELREERGALRASLSKLKNRYKKSIKEWVWVELKVAGNLAERNIIEIDKILDLLKEIRRQQERLIIIELNK